jgi:hypothetical protein
MLSLQPKWRHELANIHIIYISNKLKYIGNKPLKQELKNKLHCSLKCSFIQENNDIHVILL